jgi:hypothetical protein
MTSRFGTGVIQRLRMKLNLLSLICLDPNRAGAGEYTSLEPEN